MIAILSIIIIQMGMPLSWGNAFKRKKTWSGIPSVLSCTLNHSSPKTDLYIWTAEIYV